MIDANLLEPPRAERPRALARPGLLAVCFAYRFVAGLLLAIPIAGLVGSGVSGYPRGDAELFAPGGFMLAEALRTSAPGLRAVATSGGFTALVVLFIGLLPFGALIAGIGRQGRLPRGFAIGRATRHIGTLALIWGSAIAAQAILAALVALLGGKIKGSFTLDAPGKFAAQLVVSGAVVIAVLAVGVLRDLASISAVNDGTRYYDSIARALGLVPTRAVWSIAWAYGVRALAAAAVVFALMWVDVRLLATQGPSLFVPFLLHQGAIAFTVVLHASWLAAGMSILNRIAPRARATEPASESAPESVPASAPESVPASESVPESVPASAPASASASEAASEPAPETGAETASASASDAASATASEAGEAPPSEVQGGVQGEASVSTEIKNVSP